MLVKTNNGRTKDVPVTEVTKENYIVPENAKNQYHCVIEVRKFDANTGVRKSVPRIQTFGKKAFENTVTLLKRQGYTVTVLYDPTEYIAKMHNAMVKPVEQVKTTEQIVAEAVAKALAEQEEKHRKELDAKVAEAVKAVGAKKGGRKSKKEAEAEETTEVDAENNE